MAAGLIMLTIKDGGGNDRTAVFWSSDGTNAGSLQPVGYIKDGELVALGSTADAATTGSNGGSLIAMTRQAKNILNASLNQTAKATALTVAHATDDAVLGAAAASPAQYTLLDRLKQANRLIVATGATLTRPANTSGYTANDSISNNATAGSVTALSVTMSAYNDDPITVERVRVVTTDTGLGGKMLAMYLFNSDPTANSGVGAGDNVAYSNKMAGFVGRLSGPVRAFSDGAVAILVPDEGARILTTPGSGAKTLWYQFQTLSDFTPSANSTTLIPTFEGFQGVA